MAHQGPPDESPARGGRRRIGCWTVIAGLLLVIAALAVAWLNRENIADDIVANALDDLGIEASYTIERIGPRRQVLTDIVLGDPARPDLTIERAEIGIVPRFGFPAVDSIRLVRPRLFGTWRGGKLSFGQLDPLIFTGEEQPFEFPALDLTVEDGRALMETDYGPVGIRLAGAGYLRGGFSGELAAVAPDLAGSGCAAEDVSLFGKLTIQAERPRFAGPLRLGQVSCPDEGLELEQAALQMNLRADRNLAGIEGSGALEIAGLSGAGARIEALEGTTKLSWRDGGLTAQYEIEGTDLATGPADAARLMLAGALRARDGFARIELESNIEGSGVIPGAGFDRVLGDAARSADGTLLAPILRQIRQQLAREGRGSEFIADLTMRRQDGRTSVVMPNATLRGGSGAALLLLSRFQYASGSGATPLLSGNFTTGGEGLPRMAGRMEQRGGGGLVLRLTMARYSAGDASLAVPEMLLVQRPDGALGFVGELRADGALPGGRTEGLILPISGNMSAGGELSVWRECTDLRFDSLRLANLSLGRQGLTLCPPGGSAILRSGASGVRIAAGAPSLNVTGMLGETPIAIRSGPVGLAYPGALSAQRLNVTLGPAGTATTFAVSDLTAQIGGDVAGRFAGTDVKLYSVPLDVMGASGAWRYAGGRLTLSDGSFRLVDRARPERFEPLVASGATLALEDNLITANALLRELQTSRAVARVDLIHDLQTARGHANLAVEGLLFDDALQPTQLTALALGVVANVSGVVTGRGRIDWTEQAVTSTGRFSSYSLDFAAAFGPVKGASGTVVFSDLLGLTTAPDQRLRIASVNPGIEVFDGEISFQLVNGEVLDVNGGSWPFLGGTLTMRPVSIRFGASEVRRYIFEIDGLDAAKFIERMELNNLSVTGIFDGTIPIEFDRDGNGRLASGVLVARPPGGNLSYVGELTYEDLSPIANFAFDALRSLDYEQMRVEMNGPLTGEIVTNVQFDGVSQGEGASSNFITRQVAKLPFRFIVNIRAPFYSLITSVRAMYDPAAIRDPRDLGLIDTRGNVIRRQITGAVSPPVSAGDVLRDEAPIQPTESESVP